MKRRAAHYKGLAAGAQRMKNMGHKTASGGSNKPPKKPCRLFALLLLGTSAASVLLPTASLVQWLVS